MSSLIRNIERSAIRSARQVLPVTPHNGRGSKLGFINEALKDKPKNPPRGSRRGTHKNPWRNPRSEGAA